MAFFPLTLNFISDSMTQWLCYGWVWGFPSHPIFMISTILGECLTLCTVKALKLFSPNKADCFLHYHVNIESSELMGNFLYWTRSSLGLDNSYTTLTVLYTGSSTTSFHLYTCRCCKPFWLTQVVIGVEIFENQQWAFFLFQPFNIFKINTFDKGQIGVTFRK